MSKISKIYFLAILASSIPTVHAVAEPAPCAECESSKPLTLREQIKADRAKYDRENVKTTTRPWDGMNLGQAKVEKKDAGPGALMPSARSGAN